MVVVVVVVVVVGVVVPEKRVVHNYSCNLFDLRILSDILWFDFSLVLREGVYQYQQKYLVALLH